MSAWKEILHDELGGLPRAEQVAILVAHGWVAENALALLERQHVWAKEVNDNPNTDRND